MAISAANTIRTFITTCAASTGPWAWETSTSNEHHQPREGPRLGVEPAKHYKDYAKFEIDEPPLVLSLEPVYHRAADSFNHLGLRLGSPGAVAKVQERLEQAGVLSEREDDVECCYSRQTKFWLSDPDTNMWEVYALTAELPHRGSLASSDALAARDRSGGDAAWEHRLGLPARSELRP